MSRILYSTAIAVVVSVNPILAQPNSNVLRPAEITAAGRGEVSVTPDRAAILLSVESRAPSAAAAAAANASKMPAVFQALRAAGLVAADVTTFDYSVGQDPRTMRPPTPEATVPLAFIARNTVRANVRRMDDVGKVIDAALAAGATSVGSVQFSAPNTEEARRNALAMAVAQAQRDAETLARAAGGTLGRLLSLSSTGSAGPEIYGSDSYLAYRAEFSSRVSPTMINPRDMSLVASAFGRWEFIPGPPR
jgi:uncharacterized protein